MSPPITISKETTLHVSATANATARQPDAHQHDTGVLMGYTRSLSTIVVGVAYDSNDHNLVDQAEARTSFPAGIDPVGRFRVCRALDDLETCKTELLQRCEPSNSMAVVFYTTQSQPTLEPTVWVRADAGFVETPCQVKPVMEQFNSDCALLFAQITEDVICPFSGRDLRAPFLRHLESLRDSYRSSFAIRFANNLIANTRTCVPPQTIDPFLARSPTKPLMFTKHPNASAKGKKGKSNKPSNKNGNEQPVVDPTFVRHPMTSAEDWGVECHRVDVFCPTPPKQAAFPPRVRVCRPSEPIKTFKRRVCINQSVSVTRGMDAQQALQLVQDAICDRIESLIRLVQQSPEDQVKNLYSLCYQPPQVAVPVTVNIDSIHELTVEDSPVTEDVLASEDVEALTIFRNVFKLDEDAEALDEEMQSLRESIHHRLGLPNDRPLFRVSCAVEPSTAQTETNMIVPLRNVHIGKYAKPSGVADAALSLVRGDYYYYHYMMQSFDDKGWGCAYRSLQTIISWFKANHYTQAKVPTILEIQAMLVKMDVMDSKFTQGCKQWIGSFEVEWLINKLADTECRRIALSSGLEMEEKAREIAFHFQTQGTPIMVGGGALAYTILGVAYNSSKGQVEYLILDPHYTGKNDLETIQSKVVMLEGYKAMPCGWRTVPDAFRANAPYNLCLPLRPVQL